MPYRKYKKSRRKYSGINRFRNYKRGGYQLAKDVLYLKSVINSELHEYRKQLSSQTCPSVGSVVHLTSIAQSDTFAGRTGNTILPKYINYRATISNSNAGQEDTCRLIWFMWKDDTTPVIADVLEYANPWSHLAREHKGNPRDRTLNILKDQSVSVINGTDRQIVQLKGDIKMNPPGSRMPVHIKYDDTATTNEHNGLYLALIGTQVTNYSLVNGEVLIKFYDN